MPFTINRSMSLLLRSGKILPGGQVGREAPQPHCLPFFSFGGGREQTPHWPLGVSQLLASVLKLDKLEFSVQFCQ